MSAVERFDFEAGCLFDSNGVLHETLAGLYGGSLEEPQEAQSSTDFGTTGEAAQLDLQRHLEFLAGDDLEVRGRNLMW